MQIKRGYVKKPVRACMGRMGGWENLLTLSISELPPTYAQLIILGRADIHIYGGVLMSPHLLDKLARLLSS